MSGRKRHGGGGGRRILVWLGWSVLVVLLAANVVTAFVNKKDETPQGFLTPELLLRGSFWIPIALAFAASLAGMVWTSRAISVNERSSLLWMRRGFVFALVGTIVLALACLDAETFPRPWMAAVAAAVFGVLVLHFAIAALREYRRAEAGEGRHRRPRPDEAPLPGGEASLPADAASPDR